MYNILVADDEAIEREVIRFLLKKYEFPLNVREAANGKEALELLKKEKFDILFTDIKMPYIDGLALANKARELYPGLYIIFFSGYDDFKYVKEALSLHVINYILKPINPDEFQKTISNILQEISDHEKQNQKNDELNRMERNHILLKLLNKMNVEKLQTFYPHFDLSFVHEYHCLFLVNMAYEPANSNTARISFTPSALQESVPETCDLISLSQDQTVILIRGKRHRLQWYQELADRLISQVHKKYRVDCYIAISSFFEHPEEIAHALEEAQTKLVQNSFFTNHEQTDPDSFVSPSEKTDSESIDSLLVLLRNDIKCKNAFHLKQHMLLLIDTLKSKKMTSHIYVRFLSTNALRLLLDGLSEQRNEVFDEYVQAIYNYNHFSEIEYLLKQLTNQVAETFTEEPQYTRHALQMIKHYIQNHYGDDLSLEILAKEVCLSPRYLSSIFIKENGYGMNKYIRDVRMNKAKELLLNTNMKIKEISLKVGYPNLSYFCKCFASEYGVTPEKFRNNPVDDERN